MAINYYIKPTRFVSTDNNTENYRNTISNRHRFNVQSVKYLLLVLVNALSFFPQGVRAETVGGVSATANPVANSSGSVTNQAIQVLQGPYITNTYGNGVSCQGPTLNITPFITGANSWKDPYEPYWNDPVYDTSDLNNDGVLDNPGNVLYSMPTRTGQKSNHNINLGISATISIPLDRSLHKGCIAAANAQTTLTNQLIANKRLDFEIARMKHCAEQKRLGVSFHPKSPAFQICADIVVQNPHGVIPNHQHTIPNTTTSSSSSSSDQSDSSSSDLEGLSVGEPISEK